MLRLIDKYFAGVDPDSRTARNRDPIEQKGDSPNSYAYILYQYLTAPCMVLAVLAGSAWFATTTPYTTLVTVACLVPVSILFAAVGVAAAALIAFVTLGSYVTSLWLLQKFLESLDEISTAASPN